MIQSIDHIVLTIADLNNDGVNDIILSGYNKIGNQEGLFLNNCPEGAFVQESLKNPMRLSVR